MKKKLKKMNLWQRTLSFCVMLALLIGVAATPTGFLASALSDLATVLGADFSSVLDQTEIPFYAENPYDVNVSVGELYPVYTSQWLDNIRHSLDTYETVIYGVQDRSPWFTASIAPWYDYSAFMTDADRELTNQIFAEDEFADKYKDN